MSGSAGPKGVVSSPADAIGHLRERTSTSLSFAPSYPTDEQAARVHLPLSHSLMAARRNAEEMHGRRERVARASGAARPAAHVPGGGPSAPSLTTRGTVRGLRLRGPLPAPRACAGRAWRRAGATALGRGGRALRGRGPFRACPAARWSAPAAWRGR